MNNLTEIKVPDIGDFDTVDVIEILVSPGDTISIDDPLITLESDKASMDIPAPLSGTVKELKVAVGDKIAEGAVILMLETEENPSVAATDPQPAPSEPESARTPAAPGDSGGDGGAGLEDILVPDIGDFDSVNVIEVLVSPGDQVAVDDPLVTLESDKASMDIPTPSAGIVRTINVQVGDLVSQGTSIVTLELSAPVASANTERAAENAVPPSVPGASTYNGTVDIETELVVLGAGPGGYTAAFRAADLGQKTVLIERYPTLGGVCLNVGCIPSKALLHAAKVLDEAQEIGAHGISFSKPAIDLDKLRGWKDGVVKKLTGGLAGLARQRKVQTVTGFGQFLDAHHIEVKDGADKTTVVAFKKCIIATGSVPVKLPFLPDDPRVVDSTGALELSDIPKRLLVIGGGIIGLEMATVYHALGSKVTVVEMLDGLMAGADKDIVKPFHNRMKKRYENIWLETRVTAVEAKSKGLSVSFEGKNAPAKPALFDRILVSVGRVPNGKIIAPEQAGVAVDERGFIAVDSQQRTNIAHIFAIGDVVGQPMLAHKAVHEGKVAAEVCAGMNVHFAAKVIPSVAYTDPEVAWAGVTEAQAKSEGRAVGKGVFPWAASGRSLSLGRDEGLTKLIFDEQSGRLIGAGIVGPNAGDLIAEVALAIETHCDAADIALTVHPHPTLSETVAMAAEVFEGTITDLYLPKKR